MSRSRMALIGATLAVAGGLLWFALRDKAQSSPPRAVDAIASVGIPTVTGPPLLATPRFQPPEQKTVTVEGKTHAFTERRYDPPFALPQLDRRPPDAWMATPEAAMTSYASAMGRANWEWWQSMWDPASQAISQQHYREVEAEKHISVRDEMVKGWRTEYAGRGQVLVRRIDIPGYVIVYLRRADQPDSAPAAMTPLALKQVGDHWVVTHDLMGHPVYFYDSLRTE